MARNRISRFATRGPALSGWESATTGRLVKAMFSRMSACVSGTGSNPGIGPECRSCAFWAETAPACRSGDRGRAGMAGFGGSGRGAFLAGQWQGCHMKKPRPSGRGLISRRRLLAYALAASCSSSAGASASASVSTPAASASSASSDAALPISSNSSAISNSAAASSSAASS